jgi:hypothetical protein
MMQRTAFAAAFLLLGAAPSLAAEVTCETWPQTTTLKDIKAKYGANNVVSGELPGPEGTTYRGTTVFPENEKKTFTVTWWDEEKLENFGGVSVAQDSTGPFGLKLGMSIKDVQKINGKPFELSGFDWDYGGAPNFAGGKLEHLPGGCFVSMTFATTARADEKTYNKVAGEQTIRSDMPEAAKVKPVITDLGIGWPSPDVESGEGETAH